MAVLFITNSCLSWATTELPLRCCNWWVARYTVETPHRTKTNMCFAIVCKNLFSADFFFFLKLKGIKRCFGSVFAQAEFSPSAWVFSLMWLALCWNRYSCGNTQNTHDWGQLFSLGTPPPLHLPVASFLSNFPLCKEVILWCVLLRPTWTELQELSLRNGAGQQQHQASIRWFCGGDGFLVHARKLSVCAKYTFFHPLCPSCLAFYSTNDWVSSPLVCADAESASHYNFL